MKDKLFMLKPGFFDGARGPLYCSDSVTVEGLLSFFPSLRQKVDVVYINAPKPRQEILQLIGETNQSAPVIVLANETCVVDANVAISKHGTTRFINDPQQIARYLSSQYGVAHSS